MLETIGRRGRRAFDEHEIGLDEAFERGLQGGLIQPADLAEQRKGKIAAQNRADLRDFPLQNSSNATNFPCVRGADRPALRPARA